MLFKNSKSIRSLKMPYIICIIFVVIVVCGLVAALKHQMEKEAQSKKSEEELKKHKELENKIVEIIKIED